MRETLLNFFSIERKADISVKYLAQRAFYRIMTPDSTIDKLFRFVNGCLPK